MVNFASLLTTAAAAGSSSVETASAVGPQTCPATTSVMQQHWNKFHDDSLCDRKAFSEFKDSLGRYAKYTELKATGDYKTVPNQKTVVCPASAEIADSWSLAGIQDGISSLSVAAGGAIPVTKGYDTSWFVENTASRPVVLSWVHPVTGVEVSAFNSDVPAMDDPQALVLPGDWKVVNTYEGHVFTARQIEDDGSVGDVVLQHRAGLIPVGGDRVQSLTCPLEDVEPLIENLKSGDCSRAPEFDRTPPRELKECNLMEVGFRNMAACPLHVYWVQFDTCDEIFKFHLGTGEAVSDFAWDWKSRTKFESTFLGHSFVFRSASDGSWVDTITLAPTQIVDCPDLKQQVPTSVAQQDMVLTADGQQVQDAQDEGATNENAAATNAVPEANGPERIAFTSPGGYSM